MFPFQKNKQIEGQLFLLCAEGSLDKIMNQLCSTLGAKRKDNNPVFTMGGEGSAIRVEGVTRELGEEAGKFLEECWEMVCHRQRQEPLQRNMC